MAALGLLHMQGMSYACPSETSETGNCRSGTKSTARAAAGAHGADKGGAARAALQPKQDHRGQDRAGNKQQRAPPEPPPVILAP